MPTVELFTSPEALPGDVRHLFEHAEKISFDLSHAWFETLCASVPPVSEGCAFYVASRDGQPTVSLPLLIPPGRNTRTATSLTNFYSSLYTPICADDDPTEELCAILRQLIRDQPKLAELRFSPLDLAGTGPAALKQALRDAGMLTFPYYCFGNWYLKVDGSWEDYLARMSARRRQKTRRAIKKFKSDGGTMAIITGGVELEQAIQDFESIYTVSWKQPEPYPDFIPGLLRMLAREGCLRLGISRFNDTPIAAQIWIIKHDKASIYKLAYDEQYSSLSPGTVLTAHMMEHAIDVDAVTEVDYLIGDDEYKKNWMSDRRERWGLIAYNPRTLRGLAGAAREGLFRVAKTLLRTLKRRSEATADAESPPST